MTPPKSAPDSSQEVATHRFLVAFALGYAFIVQSGFFMTSNWMLGDLAYHRGVAYTMQAGKLVGEGPYAGLVTYYGGLFPLMFGWLAAVFDTTFDTMLSVISWFAGPIWVVALVAFARRLWPSDLRLAATFVVLGTVATPLSKDPALLWVESTLASSQNFWPLYPRDVALILLVAMGALALDPRTRLRVIGSGLAIGAMVTFHLQLAIIAGGLFGVFAIARNVVLRERRAWTEIPVVGLLALLLSAWWWIPRIDALLVSRKLLLGDYPGRLPLRLDVPDYLTSMGVIGMLSLFGFALLATPRLRDKGSLLMLTWAGALLILVGLDRLAGGFDLISERRLWVVFALPATAAAAVAAVSIVRLLPRRLAIMFVVAGLVLPLAFGAAATIRHVRGAWVDGEVAGQRLEPAVWHPIWRELNELNRERHGLVVATYDAYAPWTWSFSGTQVISTWLPGPFKLGFDPERMTGLSYADRLAILKEGLSHGVDGLCGLAADQGAEVFLLEGDAGLVATYDETPAMQFRVEPQARVRASLDREVLPHVTYRDLNAYDIVIVNAGGRYSVPWSGSEIRRIALEVDLPTGPDPAMIVTIDGRSTTYPGVEGTGRTRVVLDTPFGVGSGVAIESLRNLRLFRISGLAPVDGFVPPDGPFVIDSAGLCSNQP